MQQFDISKIEALSAYEVVRSEDLPDIHAEGIFLRHRRSGARLALIPCDDSNKVFNIGFRTPPSDSTGVAHIIEHTVLCGSREFPLKDPFVELMKGSLNTFLNAMTYPDKTIYPVASTNDADFRNLMHVYLDAVFYPNIYRDERIFKQEGWHYELTSADEPVIYNGVVYNEMKGAFSAPESILERETMNLLFPDTPYGVESGGDPECIPELTYEAYLDFHRRYYHPSNSYIYLYGDLDMADALNFIDTHYLRHFEKIKVDSSIPIQKPFAEPKTCVKEYPVSDEEAGTAGDFLSYSIVTGNPLDMKEMIAFGVLDYALFSSPGAPVKRALLDAEIGKDVNGEFNDGTLQPYFSVIVRDAAEEDAERFVQVIRDTLKKQADTGIDRHALNAALNSSEFQFREADYSHYPKGLIYGLDMLDTWLYDEDRPFDALQLLPIYRELHEAIDEGYFEQLVKTKLLENPHTGLMILRPKCGLAQEIEARAEKELSVYKASLGEGELAELIRRTADLKAWQEEPEKPEHIALLPVLRRSEIRKESIRSSNVEEICVLQREDGTEDQVRILWHDAGTNGIAYLEALYDVKCVPETDIPYLSILKSALFGVDTKKHTYSDFNNLCNEETGGISTGILIQDDPEDETDYQAFFTFSLKVLYEKLEKGTELLKEAMTESKFDDTKRLKEIVQSIRAHLESAIQNYGHVAASLRASAYTNADSAFGEAVSGISYYRFIKELETNYEERKELLRAKLEGLSRLIFNSAHMLLSATCEPEARELVRAASKNLLSKQRIENTGRRVKAVPLGIRNEGFTTAGKVQFVAQSGDLGRKNSGVNGAMSVLRQILNCDYLWVNVRVKGGAYGCSASFKRNGEGTFASFRDPNLGTTKTTYAAIPEYIRNFEADEEEMTKYVIGTVSSVDVPLTPSMFGTRSLRLWLSGTSCEEVQRRRDEILSCTAEDIRALAPAVQHMLDTGSLCVIGGETAVKAAEGMFGSVESLL